MEMCLYSRFFLSLSIILLYSSCRDKTQSLFVQTTNSQTGIHFSNSIKEDENKNALNYEYIYNGGGVGIGDFNNDSLPDIYFAGNKVSNKLYINKGNLRFEDVTDRANVGGNSKWCKGVSVIDINNDGLMDIYVCASVSDSKEQRRNLLYINQGVNKKTGIPTFIDKAKEYGLDDTSNTQMAVFFDYDNDGDLDVFLLINDLIPGVYSNRFHPAVKDGSSPNTSKLLRNDWNENLKHPFFTDVSKQAGILEEGYGLGVNITDINNDGYKDIYVSNDYISSDILYINNRNGTFSNKCSDYFKHTSKNGMGNDVEDINNDGLPDVVELDMAPADNYRLKMMFNDVNYQTYENYAKFDYMHQYVRNTLQLNQGATVKENDSMGTPVFSEIGYYAGITNTDWSWAPLGIDADNDGYRDLLISNGLPHDMSDLDFISYKNSGMNNLTLDEIMSRLQSVNISNYIFKNNGNLTFTNKVKDWGWDFPTISSGMACADFDRDGDVDVVMNNTNMESTLIENKLNEQADTNHNYLRIKFIGGNLNRDGIGTIVKIYYGDKQQFYDNTPYRGYLSSIENVAHFGVSSTSLIDSVVIVWSRGEKQVLKNVKPNQTLYVNIKDAHEKELYNHSATASNNWFTDIAHKTNVDFLYKEEDFVDFYYQHLIPHKLTQYGPSLATGDLNSDGLEDIIAGGGSPYCATLFYQQKDGTFNQQKLYKQTSFKYQDDGGICIFDANDDGKNDIYIASGGAENGPGYNAYKDHIYINNGNGKFIDDSLALKPNYTAKSCVKAADFDGDGDLDLFIGGRVLPGSYPMPVSSLILRNDSQNGKVKFTDVTRKVAPSLINIGMVSDAIWSDVDNDGKPDLIIAGEWMPITILENENGKFTKIIPDALKSHGWWNSITAADIDNDGDMDYVLGNYGLNGFIKASPGKPVKGYGKDFDGNGNFDAVFTMPYQTSLTDTSVKEYPLAGRDEMISEMVGTKRKFPEYSLYAKATLNDILPPDQLTDAVKVSADNLQSCWIENKGNMQFVMHALPAQAQWSPLYGIVADDFNNDGNIDIVLNGNEYSMSPSLGRNDALNGLLLQGDGKGNFKPLSILESGIYIPGNGKALIQLNAGDKQVIAAAQNSGYLKLFQLKNLAAKIIHVNADDVYAIIHLQNGKTRKQEFSYGSGFMSQSGRDLILNSSVKYAEVVNDKKQKREVANQ